MPKSCSSSNPAKPVLARLSAIRSLKKHPYSYAEIEVFKTNKERSLSVMKKYLRGASDEMLEETYSYFSTRMPKLPYPSTESIKTALEMMADQFPQATGVDPSEVVDLSFVKQIEAGGSAR
jgi:hypothetical protein